MTEVTPARMYEVLKRVQQDLADVKIDVREIRSRAAQLETGVANCDASVSTLRVEMANISQRLDRRDEIMERVMRCLDLVDQT
jgi:predicted  nucleic acid-binding Zn-ribbon protein